MANRTVYPYGTGGELPSNIGIINDLTTGGADKALSAQMGKELSGELFGGQTIIATKEDASVYQVKAGVESNKPNRLRVVLPIEAGQGVRASCLLGKGVAVSIYPSINSCIAAGLDFVQSFSYTYTGHVNGVAEAAGYLTVSLAKTNDGDFSSSDMTNYLAALELAIIGPSDGLIPNMKDNVEHLIKAVDGQKIVLNSSDFIQGTNDEEGQMVSSTKRLITPNFISLQANNPIKVAPNGQKYVILSYDDADGLYEGTTGWITAQETKTYRFEEDKKVRFVVAYTSDTTITPAQLAAQITIESIKGLDERVTDLEAGNSEVAFTSGNDLFSKWNKTFILYNPYKDRPQNAYKGQMHCHSNNSDGTDSPATVVGKYLSEGYDFITITDHNYITPDPGVAGIVWMGASYEDTHNSSGFQHMNVYNADAVLNKSSMYQTSNTPLMIVDHFVREGDSVVSYNHPEYPAVYASDSTLESLPRGISFVEVFNGSIQTLLGTVSTTGDLPAEAYYGDMYDCTADGKRYKNTSYTYDTPSWSESDNEEGNLDRGFRILLDKGRKVFCNSVDDYHTGDTMFNRGWMVAFAEEKTADSIWNALLRGCSYASEGVTLTDLQVKGGKMSLSIADGASAVTTFYGEDNTVLATVNGASASYQIQGTEKYVRAMVEIGRFKAWTQPVWIIGERTQYDF